MHTSTLDQVLWAVGFLGHAALFLTLLLRHRMRQFPAFSAYIGFQIVTTAVLFADYWYLHALGYAPLYWVAALVDFCLLVGVLSEVALHVLRPAGRWVMEARGQLALWTGLGILVALALTFWVSPLHAQSPQAWQYRGNLFTSIVICELFTAILLTSQRAGAYWRSRVVGVGAGLTVWALVSFAADALQTQWLDGRHHVLLQTVRKMAWLVALGYWIVNFWRDEPEKEQLPPGLQNVILQHANRLSYDLAEALGTRERESR